MKAVLFKSSLLALSFAAALGLGPALADIAEPESGAKGLFFEQLERPTEAINTGLRYWIELKRGKVTSRVSNKYQFKSGDHIAFHVRANIDGYAYILLSSGSRGEQSVLFPDSSTGESNRVERGHDYILPATGTLTFDENPGTEKLTLLLSRSPIDAQAYLSKPTEQVTMIASAVTGSKDLVPAKIYVSYNAPRNDGPPVFQHEAKPEIAKVEAPVRTVKPAIDDKPKSATRPVKKKPPVTSHSSSASVRPTSHRNENDEGTTTVVSENSAGILHVDVALEHI